MAHAPWMLSARRYLLARRCCHRFFSCGARGESNMVVGAAGALARPLAGHRSNSGRARSRRSAPGERAARARVLGRDARRRRLASRHQRCMTRCVGSASRSGSRDPPGSSANWDGQPRRRGPLAHTSASRTSAVAAAAALRDALFATATSRSSVSLGAKLLAKSPPFFFFSSSDERERRALPITNPPLPACQKQRVGSSCREERVTLRRRRRRRLAATAL